MDYNQGLTFAGSQETDQANANKTKSSARCSLEHTYTHLPIRSAPSRGQGKFMHKTGGFQTAPSILPMATHFTSDCLESVLQQGLWLIRFWLFVMRWQA